jgi:glycosyltransferase involved in cell wall biosynthesis
VKIAYICDGFPALSQTFVQNELRELHRRGIEPRVFALYRPDGPDPTAGDLAFTRLPSIRESPAFAGALVRVVRRRPLGFMRMVALAAARPSRYQLHCLGRAVRLLDALGADSPERLHAHFARGSASTAMLAAAALGCPFSFTAHANDIFQAPFDVARKLRRADVTITVCEYNRGRIEAMWPGLGRVVIVPCGVRPEQFRRGSPYRSRPFTVVAVSRLVEKKGFDVLVEACSRLRDDGLDFTCRIVGEGPERPRLETLVRHHHLETVVALEGAMTADGIRAALEEASVFVLPNVIAVDGDLDSQPVVTKEAMAMEVPVVTTDEVGNPEIVDSAVGRLVPVHDPAALAGAITELAVLDDGALRAMGEAGRRRIEEKLDLTRLVDDLVAAWVGHRNGPR